MDKVWFDGFRANIIYNSYVLIGAENHIYFKIFLENEGGGVVILNSVLRFYQLGPKLFLFCIIQFGYVNTFYEV